jgi:hypothetical protein
MLKCCLNDAYVAMSALEGSSPVAATIHDQLATPVKLYTAAQVPCTKVPFSHMDIIQKSKHAVAPAVVAQKA